MAIKEYKQSSSLTLMQQDGWMDLFQPNNIAHMNVCESAEQTAGLWLREAEEKVKGGSQVSLTEEYGVWRPVAVPWAV